MDGLRKSVRRIGLGRLWVRLSIVVLVLAIVMPATSLAAGPVTRTQDVRKDLWGWQNVAGDWVHSSLGNPHATYEEGDTVPFRFTAPLAASASGTEYTVVLEYDFTKGGAHGFDSLGSFNKTVASVDPCAGVDACGSASTWTIPTDSSLPAGAQLTGSLTTYNVSGLTFSSYTSPTTSSGAQGKSISLTFKVVGTGTKNVVIAFGGHFATGSAWGEDLGVCGWPGGSSPKVYAKLSSDSDFANVPVNPICEGPSTPGLSITKTAEASVSIGDPIHYVITVTNTGDVTLHNVIVNDAMLGITDQNIGDLVPGDSQTINETYGPVTESDLPGPVENTASAECDEVTTPITASWSVAIVTHPGLSITKTAEASVSIGGTIHYVITVENTGDVTLHDVLVNDAMLGITDESIGDLAVGASSTINETYGPVTESDLPGPIDNTASAECDEVIDPVEASWSVSIVTEEGLTIAKAAEASVSIGGIIHYAITVQNTGDVTLHNVIVNDAMLGITDRNIGDLAPGDSETINETYGPVTEDDLPGPIENTASVESDEVTDPIEDSWSVSIVTKEGLSITKTADKTVAQAGDTIHYTITVQNTGDVTLTGVTVVDAKLGITATIGSLAAGGSWTHDYDYTVTGADATAGSIVNTATAVSNETDPVTASWTVGINTPPPPPCTRADVAVRIYGGWNGIPVNCWVGGTEQPTLYTALDSSGVAAVHWTFDVPAGATWSVRVEPQLPAGLDPARWKYDKGSATVSIRGCGGGEASFQLIDKGDPGKPTPVPLLPVTGGEAAQAGVWQQIVQWFSGLFSALR